MLYKIDFVYGSITRINDGRTMKVGRLCLLARMMKDNMINGGTSYCF
jgi:hypothetical protein